MSKPRKAVADKPTSVSSAELPNNGAPDFGAEVSRIIADYTSADVSGNKRESSLGDAAFRLAHVLVMDALPMDVKFNVLRQHRPGLFFNSPEVRAVWNKPDTRNAFFGAAPNADDVHVAQYWRRTVEVAFTLWAWHEAFAYKGGVYSIDFVKRTIPAFVWCNGMADWSKTTARDVNKSVPFGAKQVGMGAFDAEKKVSKQNYTYTFTPSLSKFADSVRVPLSWLNVEHTKQKRATRQSGSNAITASASLTDGLNLLASTLAGANNCIFGEAADVFGDMLRAYIAASDSNRAFVASLLEEVAQEQARAA